MQTRRHISQYTYKEEHDMTRYTEVTVSILIQLGALALVWAAILMSLMLLNCHSFPIKYVMDPVIGVASLLIPAACVHAVAVELERNKEFADEDA